MSPKAIIGQALVWAALIIVAVIGFVIWDYDGSLHPVPTVDGPEDANLASHWHGTIFNAAALSTFTVTSLPSRQSFSYKDTDPGAIYQESGPDNSGTIAYVSEGDKGYSVKVMSREGRSTTVYSAPGSPLWDHVVGNQLALSPSTDRIGLLAKCKDDQMEDPSALLFEGSIEVWSINKPAANKTKIQACDAGLSWFPDGKRLAYVAMVDRAKVANALDFGKDVGWPMLPVVSILNVETGKSFPLGIGWHPVVSLDGKTVVVQEWDNSLRSIDIATRRSKTITVPDLWSQVVAVNGPDILYWGLPTKGAKIQFTKYNSPLSGPKLVMTIKAAVANTDRFLTIVPYVDPRDISAVSYGTAILRKRSTAGR